jgi:hypothetical protein
MGLPRQGEERGGRKGRRVEEEREGRGGEHIQWGGGGIVPRMVVTSPRLKSRLVP